jgi:hypothetical protein
MKKIHTGKGQKTTPQSFRSNKLKGNNFGRIIALEGQSRPIMQKQEISSLAKMRFANGAM